MKNHFTFFASLVLLAALPLQSKAQVWGDLSTVFGQLTEDEQGEFIDQLDDLQQNLDYSSFELGNIVDSLNLGLDVLNPGGPIDSMLNAWNAGGDSLSVILSNSNLDVIDSLAIMQEYNQVNDIWELNLDSLGTLLDQYGEGTDYPADDLNDAVNQFEAFQGLWTQYFNDLEEVFSQDLEDTGPGGLGNMSNLLDTLFRGGFDLEIAFGQFSADANFWGEQYDTRAMEIRVGSVPRFENLFETRWHVQASYLNKDEVNFEEVSTLKDGLNALRYDANFSLMYNPVIGSIGQNGSLRLYSSLGMEAGTYVPAHADAGNPETADRVGNTTGWGPQIGAGFVITTGDINIYSYGTIAQGTVNNSPGYQYQSTGARAGIRYGDVAHVSYQYIRSIWAPSEGKLLSGSSISLGLIF